METQHDEKAGMPIGEKQLQRLTDLLRKYNAGKAHTTARIQSSEQWWKLRNSCEEQKTTQIGKDGGFVSTSGWLHNVIVSKHADAMESYPEPNILPREAGDRQEAQMLSDIIPCVLEQNQFERTYSNAMWQKLKTGTGVYKVVWSKDKLGGLGDICVETVNLLNVYWEPGVTDIQRSRYVFHTELRDKDLLLEQYPQLEDKLKSSTFVSAKFLYDDSVNTEDKQTVIECYYHKMVGGKNTLQYVQYVGDTVLYATENEPDMAQRGLYDHGKYPYVFDTLYPIEGSPCGYKTYKNFMGDTARAGNRDSRQNAGNQQGTGGGRAYQLYQAYTKGENKAQDQRREATINSWANRYNQLQSKAKEGLSDDFLTEVSTLMKDYNSPMGVRLSIGYNDKKRFDRAYQSLLSLQNSGKEWKAQQQLQAARAQTASGLLPEDANEVARQRQMNIAKYESTKKRTKDAEEELGKYGWNSEEYKEARSRFDALQGECDRLAGLIGDMDSMLTIYNRVDRFHADNVDALKGKAGFDTAWQDYGAKANGAVSLRGSPKKFCPALYKSRAKAYN